MKFGVIGMSYKEADASIRSCVAFRDSLKIECYAYLLDHGVEQAVILSTCNRSEVYFLYDEKDQKQVLVNMYRRLLSEDQMNLLYEKDNQEALLHLFEVGVGYHSMVIGEDQIEGQLQDAYRFAVSMHACQKAMHLIFQSCFHCIKQVKTKYHINAYPLSIPYMCSQYLKKAVDLKQQNVLLIGSGEIASLMLTYLVEEGVSTIYLCNRHYEKAKALQQQQVQVVPFEERYDYMSKVAIIISATSSPHTILRADHMLYPSTSQIFVDLAIPKDIDPACCSRIDTLLTIDDFAHMQDHHIQKRKALLNSAQKDIQEAVRDTVTKLQQEPIYKVVTSLQKMSEEQADATYQLILRKLSLEKHEQKVLKKILDHSFYQMVKEPMMALHKVKDHQVELSALVKQLYDLEDTK